MHQCIFICTKGQILLKLSMLCVEITVKIEAVLCPMRQNFILRLIYFRNSRLQRSKHGSNSARSSEQQDMVLFFMYRSLEYIILTSCSLRPLRHVILLVGSLKLSALPCSRMVRAREWDFSILFSLSVMFNPYEQQQYVT